MIFLDVSLYPSIRGECLMTRQTLEVVDSCVFINMLNNAEHVCCGVILTDRAGE